MNLKRAPLTFTSHVLSLYSGIYSLIWKPRRAVETSYLGLEGGRWPVLGNPLTAETKVGDAVTSAHLSVVGHDDQLHVLGRGLDMALVLRRGGGEDRC